MQLLILASEKQSEIVTQHSKFTFENFKLCLLAHFNCSICQLTLVILDVVVKCVGSVDIKL